MSDIIANIGADAVKALLDALKDNRIVATFQKLEKENPINKGHVMIVATITMESMGEVFNPNGQKADGNSKFAKFVEALEKMVATAEHQQEVV